MLTPELEESLYSARRDALRRGFGELTIEHLTLILLDNKLVKPFVESESINIAALRDNLLGLIHKKPPPPQKPKDKDKKTLPEPAPEVWCVLLRAQKAYGSVNGMHFLAETFAERRSLAAYHLKKSGIDRISILAHLAKHPSKIAEEASESEGAKGESTFTGTDWVEMARNGELEKPFGRHAEIVQLLNILMRKYKRNPLLVGKPGVGKTAVVRALAHGFGKRGQEPGVTRIMPVSMNDMVAGTRYRGDFEQRMRDLCDECKRHPGIILFIDDIHTLIGAGAASGTLDAADILKPMMDDNTIRCIGATTESEYSRIFAKDEALSRRFQKINIAEPQGYALMQILESVSYQLEKFHDLSYSEEALDAAVRLSRRFLPGRFFPDKGIDMLDDAGARRRASDDDDTVVGADDVAEAVAECAGLPVAVVREDDKQRLAGLESKLRARVVEQPEAVRRLCGAVLRARLGYHDGGRTAGTFLFAGPTGVGKTEMARQLADLLALPLLRYDMSEYMEAHSAAKLIGAPPGYVGFDERGRLTEDITAQPAAVVLFDEIDKAHPDVLSLLLQIMDYASLSDSGGRQADFSNALIILTSNAGAREYQSGSVGFERNDNSAAAAEALSRLHTPEFRNRLDAIVHFKSLSQKATAKILSRRLQQITADLSKRKDLRLTITPKMQKQLIADGFSPTMGARPLERLLRERILEPLARAEAKAPLPKTCQIDWQDQTAIIRIPVAKPQTPKKESAKPESKTKARVAIPA